MLRAVGVYGHGRLGTRVGLRIRGFAHVHRVVNTPGATCITPAGGAPGAVGLGSVAVRSEHGCRCAPDLVGTAHTYIQSAAVQRVRQK
ncbi:hypothetical protein MAUB_33460 [Mycolicibacterium aubagnense]|uniref:Uncharacterized protein n=1 Tax=Mycolicibacterium aubagnense TaxID=319707 RepID=A0ABM7IFK4_9MYCO|nr:hypothetical protein MAUB_33460 [Mycolicibacterium aubagnense]